MIRAFVELVSSRPFVVLVFRGKKWGEPVQYNFSTWCSMENFAEIISHSWQEVEIAFAQETMSFVEVAIRGASGQQQLVSPEACCNGRFLVQDLTPDCDYHVEVQLAKGSRQLSFRSLPLPHGSCSCRYAVIADPHLSASNANRKGRLFQESASILRDVVEHVNAFEVDFCLIAGDLTNSAAEEEFLLAREILKNLQSPVLCSPGDHDLKGDGSPLWDHYLADLLCTELLHPPYKIISLDTSSKQLTSKDIARLQELLPLPLRPLLLTHVHLLPNAELCHGQKREGVGNYHQYQSLFLDLGKKDLLIYAGHQNIPNCLQTNGICQINTPQISQYLCCWYLVEEYDNGLYHRSIPIKSEILRQQSRHESQLAAEFYQEKQWETSYRQGKNAASRSFIVNKTKFTA